MSKVKYKISVIIPIYNLEKYIEEAITSVVDQTLGFNNIQLILIDDGSTDGSADICQKFADEYANVTLIKNEHRGVSAARNTGLVLAKGEYINFFDGDDIWASKALKRGVEFMDEHPEIDVASGRLRFFEAKSGYTKNDFRFKKTNRIIDIYDEPQSVQLGVCSSIFRADAIKGMSFDEKLEIGEDAKFINDVILRKGKYGALRFSLYNVRKRADTSSATQVKRYSLTRLTNTVELYLKYFCDLSEEKYGRIIPYVQYLVMNSVRNRTIEQLPDDIPEDIREKYIDELFNIVRRMDDEILINISHTPYNNKLFCLWLKYGDDLKDHINVKDGILCFDDKSVTDLKKQHLLTIEKIEFERNTTVISGIFRGSLYYDSVLKSSSGDLMLAEAFDLQTKAVDGSPQDRKYRFKLTLPAGDSDVAFMDENNGITFMNYKFTDDSILSVNGIRHLEKNMYVFSDTNGLHIRQDSFLRRIRRKFSGSASPYLESGIPDRSHKSKSVVSESDSSKSDDSGSAVSNSSNLKFSNSKKESSGSNKSKKKKNKTMTKEDWVRLIASDNGWTEDKARSFLDHMKDNFGFKPIELKDKDLNSISQTGLVVQILLDRRKKLRSDKCYEMIRKFSGKTRKRVRSDLKAIHETGKEKAKGVNFRQYYRYNGYSLDTTDAEAVDNWLAKLNALRNMNRDLTARASYEGYSTELEQAITPFAKLIREMLSEGKKAQNYSFLSDVRPGLEIGTEAYDELMTDVEVTNCILGFRADEYAIFHFWDKPLSERMTYISDKKRGEILSLFNPPEGADILNDKYATYQRLSELYGRYIALVSPPDGYDTFLKFCENHREFVKKSNYDSLGRGVEKITIDDDTDLKRLYNNITSDGKYIILEELIRPHQIIRDLNPSSVNTVRITTFFKDGNVFVQDSFMKIGRDGSFVDNGGAGGIIVHVDKDSGITDSHGIIETGITFDSHPDHGYDFRGIQLPEWDKALELVRSAGKEITELRYIGWDVTYTADNKWIIVEGNAKTQFFGQQSTVGVGKLDQLMKIVE